MKECGTSRLLLILPDISFHVNLIPMHPTLPHSLIFQRQVGIQDYPCLHQGRSPSQLSHLAALLISNTNSPTNQTLLHGLESSLENPNSSHMMELVDSDSLENVYILVHRLETEILGPLLDRSALGLFRYSQTELYNHSVEHAYKFIRDMKATKGVIMREFVKLKSDYKQSLKNSQYYFNVLNGLQSDNKTIKQNYEVSKNAVTQLSYQLNNLQDKLGRLSATRFDCQFCTRNYKNVMFLPCGHIVGCKDCVARRMDIQIGQKLRAAEVCMLCKLPIDEAREVFYS